MFLRGAAAADDDDGDDDGDDDDACRKTRHWKTIHAMSICSNNTEGGITQKMRTLVKKTWSRGTPRSSRKHENEVKVVPVKTK